MDVPVCFDAPAGRVWAGLVLSDRPSKEAGFEVWFWGFAMWGLLAWLLLLAATVVLASVAFHFDVAQAPGAFQALSPAQQIAAILIALVALALTASTLWQSWRLTREAQDVRAAQGGMSGAK